MDWIEKMTAAVDYIEDNINSSFLQQEVSKIACCSMYQYGRIFSYITGISLSEYIRRRRLTLAAFELQNDQVSVIDIGLKYGYDSPDAFTRAFKNQHGVTPIKARDRGVSLKSYPPLSFQIHIRGENEVEYRIIEKKSFSIVGKVKKVDIISTDDIFHEICREIWDDFFDDGTNEKLKQKYKLYRDPLYQVGFYRDLEGGGMEVAIGAEGNGNEYPDLDSTTIPDALWAVISATGKTPESAEDNWTRAVTEWLPSSGYVQAGNFIMDSFPPGDARSDEYRWGIWIPISKK